VLLVPDSLSPEEFEQQIARETDGVELKSGTSKLGEAMVAFSNTESGVIWIGVTDTREVIGRRLDQGLDDKIQEAALAANNLGRFEVKEVAVGGLPVVAVIVHRREEGFAQTSDGRILVRRGGRNVPLIGSEAEAFVTHRRLRRFEQADSGVPIDAADDDLLDQMCGMYNWPYDSPSTRTALVPRLRERGLATGDNLTIAGALILTDPSKSLKIAKAYVEVLRYPNERYDYDRRVTFAGSLPHQVREATRFVVDELGSDLVVTGVYRYDLPKLPEVVIREALANAVGHRSYELHRMAIRVELRPDRVVVQSPGALPEGVTVASIREAQAPRNPVVIDVLRRFQLAEDAGRGIDVIQDVMQANLLDPPVFRDDGSSVVVELPLKGPITTRERAWVVELEQRQEIDVKDRLLLVHAARGKRLTNALAREILGADSGQARQALQRLVRAELLRQDGTRGGATYALVDQIAPPAAYRMSGSEIEDLVLQEAAAQPLTNERVRELTGMNRTSTLRLLSALVDRGLLVRHGERRGTAYSRPPA
jgi:ATP-dependent DNA helicase RecG